MKKLFFKLTLFFLPFVVVGILPAFSPLYYFTFRHWEGVSVCKKNFFAGPFYPLQKSILAEEGDMGHGTPYAIKKTVYWETDRYGYRKKDFEERPDVVIIGDSNTAGSGLTQDDIFSEVLQKKISRSVYPYAPDTIHNFLRDTRFITNPPRVVILENIEGAILKLEPLQIKPEAKNEITSKLKWLSIQNNRLLLKTMIVLDRIQKQELVNYAIAHIMPRAVGVRYHEMFFLSNPPSAIVAKESEIQNVVKIIKAYNDYFKKKNILFIFMPIPNRETIYYDSLFTKQEFSFLRQVQQDLKRDGVPVIDLLHAFDAFKQEGGNSFQFDDTHWNAMGVKIAADLAATIILHSE